MRLSLLFLVLLLVCQALAARTPAAKPKKQFLQLAIAISGNCKDIDPVELLETKAELDVRAYFTDMGQQDIRAVSARLISKNDARCRRLKDSTHGNLARFLISVSWKGPDMTEYSNALLDAATVNGCEGGIDGKVFPKLSAAFDRADHIVAYRTASLSNPATDELDDATANNCGYQPSPPPASPKPKRSPRPPKPSPPNPAPEPTSPQPDSSSPSPPATKTCADFACATGTANNLAASSIPLTYNFTLDQATCCRPVNCSAIPNSVLDPADGSCKCLATGFTVQARDGDALTSCLASSITQCPANYITAVRDNNSRIVSCQTPSSACPASYTFPLYGGIPAVRQQCRPAVAGCTITNYNVPIKSDSGDIIGCVANTRGSCPAPYVGFRSYKVQSYSLQECRAVSACPAYEGSGGNQDYTVGAYDATSNLKDCLTINYNGGQPGSNVNACPGDVAGNNASVEVFFSSPNGCGEPGRPCTVTPDVPSTYSRTIKCLALGASCPAGQSLMLFNHPDGSPGDVAVVECREARAKCDLVLSDEATNPSPGSYLVPVKSAAGDQLVGCVVSSATKCPAGFPMATFDSKGKLAECRAQHSGMACPHGQIPGLATSGVTAACFTIGTNCGVGATADFPIAVRSHSGGLEACLATGSTCPTNRPFPFYGNLESNSGRPATLLECWPSAEACTMEGWTKPVKTSDATTSVVGCLSTAVTTTECPVAAGFGLAYRDAAGIVQECRPSNQTSCPATGSYNVQGRNATALAACLTVSNQCPANFPVFVRQSATLRVVVHCRNAATCPPDYPFVLRRGNSLQGCQGPDPSPPDCSTFTGFTGPATVDASGAWVGCATSGTNSCPVGFIPYGEVDGDGVVKLVQCRAGLLEDSTCTTQTVTIKDVSFKVNLRNGTNIVGCVSLKERVCPTTYPVPVSKSLSSSDPVTDCLPGRITNCPVIIGPDDAPYSFPLYKGSIGATPPSSVGTTAIAACVARNASDSNKCDSYTGFPAEVYAGESNTNLRGCLAQDGSTRCPADYPMIFLESRGSMLDWSMVVAINSCRTQLASCQSTNRPGTFVQANYTAELRTNGKLQGCKEVTGPSTRVCVYPGDTNPYTFPTPMLGARSPLSDGTPDLMECRNDDAITTDCESVPDFPIPVYLSTDTSMIVGVDACMARNTRCPTADDAEMLDAGFALLAVDGGTILECRPKLESCVVGYEVAVSGSTDTGDSTDLRACMQTGAGPKACHAVKVVNNYPLPGTGYGFPVFVQDIPATLNPQSAGTLKSCNPSSTTCSGDYGIPVTLDSNKQLVGCVGNTTRGLTQAMCDSWSPFVEPPSVSCGTPPPLPSPSPVTCPEFSDLRVTGSLSGGRVWGSGPYTTDSDFNRAAVHAGLVSVGESAIIELHQAGYLNNYVGSSRNGVETLDYTDYYCGVNITLAEWQ